MNLPKHIAIVMDGNGRWASQRGYPRMAGHKAGVNALREVVQACGDWGIEVLTVFAFSTENWRRPSFEVKHLSRLFLESLKRFIQELHKNNVRVRFIGDYEAFGANIQKQADAAMQLTEKNTGLQFVIALNYSGRHDIVKATQKIACAVQAGELMPEEINESCVSRFVDLHELSAPDLFIRTSGEMRISNFLLWQVAYAELFFSERLWPDFGAEGLKEALAAYANRERRFGKTSQQIVEEQQI